MEFEKLGHIFCPDGRSHPWMASHASYPVAVPVSDEIVRVYFSPRDADNRSYIAWLDMSLHGNGRVVRVSDEPVLAPGARGAFDDSGVTVGSLVRHNGKLHLYYLGWSLGTTVPFRNFIGLAVETPDGRFERISQAPVLDRNHSDPFCLGYPWVRKEEGSWRIWYGSHLRWGNTGAEMVHVLKTTSSSDGVNWPAPRTMALDVAGGAEFGLSRPCVIFHNNSYHMWFSVREETYRIGYASSSDGVVWHRNDAEAGLSRSPEGWDSQAVCYPSVFEHAGRLFMLYNGNQYGRTGFGLARLRQ